MSRIMCVLTILAVLVVAIPPAAAYAQPNNPLPPNCVSEVGTSVAETYVICVNPAWATHPFEWTHDLVVFAHGYEFATGVPGANANLGQEQWVITNGTITTTLPELVNTLGFAFATTSYRKDGLAVKEGVEDILALVNTVRAAYPAIRNVYLVGASEGGLVTTLSLEKHPESYKAGLALCGPVGDFQKQINYWGDFRTLLDFYFPSVFLGLGDAVTIPPGLMLDWLKPLATSTYKQALTVAMAAKPADVAALLTISKAPYDPSDPVNSIAATTVGILSYNIFATNEAELELGVQPYDNSGNAALLALGAHAYTATGDVATALLPYQTSGVLKAPLVTMHTLGDPIVPAIHEDIYKAKVGLSHSNRYLSQISVQRYGHCAFKPSEMLFSFALMLYKATQQPISLTPFQAMLAGDPASVLELTDLNKQFGDITRVQTYMPIISSQP